MRRYLIAGAILALALAGGAIAQQLTFYNLTGAETFVVSIGGIGGQSTYATINQVRNSSGHQLVATGTTVASAPTNAVGNLIATGAITTWNVTLPNPAFDGEVFSVVNGTGSSFSSNTTVTATTTPQNQTLAQTYSSQTLSAGASAEWQYDYATLTWYRMR